MARTELTPISVGTDWAIAPVAITWTAADNANGNYVDFTGKEILLVRNDNVGAQVVTVASVADKYGRTGDQTQAVPAAAYRMFGSPFPSMGWEQPGAILHIDAAAADVFLCVIKL